MPRISKILSKSVTVAAAGTPVAICAATDANRFVSFFRAFTPSANGGNIFIGASDVSSTTHIPRGAGSYFEYRVGDGKTLGNQCHGEFDLSKVYVDTSNNGDSVIIEYFVKDTL